MSERTVRDFNAKQTVVHSIKLALNLGAHYSDSRLDTLRRMNIRYIHDGFERANTGIVQGLGIRVLYRGAWGFASTVDLSKNAIGETVGAALRVASVQAQECPDKVNLAKAITIIEDVPSPGNESLVDVKPEEKMDLCKRMVKTAREYDEKIRSATASYLETVGKRTLATSEGTLIEENESRFYYSIKAIARHDEKTVSALENCGQRGGADELGRADPDAVATLAAERAVFSSVGVAMKHRRLPILLDQKLAGVFIHEAVGHSAEADQVIANESVLKNKMGERVGSEFLNVYDDPTLKEGWGTRKYDNEGTLAITKTLLKNGLLAGYILDRERASRLGSLSNGGSLVQSFEHRPIPRMSNTYIGAGELSFEELLEDIKRGVFFRGTMGGQADPSTGTFQFSAEDAQLIENGELKTALLGISFSGDTLKTLRKIDGVGKSIHHYPIFCVKSEQSVATAVGGPHIRIRAMPVGD